MNKNFKLKKEIPSCSFYFLFSEIVQHCIKKNPREVEKQLEEFGYPIGARMLELVVYRDCNSKKELGIVKMLMLIKLKIWPALFNREAPSIEQHENIANIYMIKEDNSICNRYACLPRSQRHINCSAFTAGIVEGLLNAAGYACKVNATFDHDDSNACGEEPVEKTAYIIYFAPEVVEKNKEIKY